MEISCSNMKEISPDEWDLKMLEEIEKTDCHEFISQDDLFRELNMTL